jgi:MFS transporter, OPA family, glycerol-3-phosphate transporter
LYNDRVMALFLVSLCVAAAIAIYFCNNPMKHGRWFVLRRFINWFPLGMTYAFLVMGRYNLNVAKVALGSLMTKEQFGWIFFAGTWTYAGSFVINGPLVDKIGGKKGIIIAAIGAAVANALLGVLTYLILIHRVSMNLAVPFSLLYALNMYFQSYGAMSIIKVKAYWFHVRERGVFGAVFGTLISVGVYFAFDWGSAIATMAKVQSAGVQGAGWLQGLIQKVFASHLYAVDATWAVFFVPAGILVFWALMDWWLIRDLPEEAGFPYLDTHDASSGVMHLELTTLDLLKKVFTSRLMLLVALVDFTSGVLRNGIYQWYPLFAGEAKQVESKFFVDNWGLLLCIFGILGGFGGGLISDRWFQSRRGPPAAILNGSMLVLTGLMAVFLFTAPLIVGWAAVLISMTVIGVHSLMSGTAAADFGGRKATATCSGIVDGFVYLGTGLQSVSLGYLTTWNWHSWPIFLMPFALIGGLLAMSFWNELPAATRRYIAEVEQKPKPADGGVAVTEVS